MWSHLFTPCSLCHHATEIHRLICFSHPSTKKETKQRIAVTWIPFPVDINTSLTISVISDTFQLSEMDVAVTEDLVFVENPGQRYCDEIVAEVRSL